LISCNINDERKKLHLYNEKMKKIKKSPQKDLQFFFLAIY